MTSKERIIATLSGNATDRIPVSLYEIDGYSSVYAPSHVSYKPIIDYVRKNADNMVMYSPKFKKFHWYAYLGNNEEISTDKNLQGSDEIYSTSINTPLGKLYAKSKRSSSIYTLWTTEFLIKSDEDIDKILSLPYKKIEPVVDDFLKLQKKIGDNGITMIELPDPIGLVSSMMDFNNFMLISYTNRIQFRKLLDFFSMRINDFLDKILSLGLGPLFRIIGPEVCTPPYMKPSDFKEFVVNYDKPLINKIHKAGHYARIHCHGNIAQVTDLIMEMHPDALDPIEAPPSGDITLQDIKNSIGQEICLMGNIQESMLEISNPEEISKKVYETLEIGSQGGKFILMPTATPITIPLPEKIERNLFAFMEAGLKQ